MHRDLAKAGVGSGLRSPIELTRAEADLASLDIGRIRARGNLLTAETVFAAVAGVAGRRARRGVERRTSLRRDAVAPGCSSAKRLPAIRGCSKRSRI